MIERSGTLDVREAVAGAGRERGDLGPLSVASFAFGSFGTGVFSTVPSVLLLFYCTEIVGLPAAWATAIVFAPKAWAILWDPFVGAWSDRTHSRWGRRRPFIAAGAIGVALAIMALFHPPPGAGATTAVWIGLAYFALATTYSLFAVPYTALPAEIGRDAGARSRLISARMALLMVGILAGAAVAPMLVEAFGGGRPGYGTMSLLIGAAAGLAMLAPLMMLGPHDPARPATTAKARPSDPRRLPLGDRPLRLLTLAFLILLTAIGAVSAAGPYLIVGALGRSQADVGIALGASILTTAFTVPVWGWLGRRFEERRVLCFAAILYAAAQVGIGAAALAGLPWPLMIVGFAIAGLPMAALQVLPFVAAAHLIRDYVDREGGAEGVLTGAWTATEKLGLACGPAITGLAIGATRGGHGSIPLFLMIAPTVLALLALIPLVLSMWTSRHAGAAPHSS
ncbi:MFS transporter [Phenylobacterium sp.]|uniref:MFS transporter n=1 Tax=Phenylobacterium sp. TaxID=1871053 RepID=UPI0037840A87